MTLIVALKDEKGISIGCDRFASNYYSGTEMIDDKVFQIWDLIFGICGSLRLLNILQYHFTPPDRGSKVDAKTYMYKYVLEEIKKLLHDKNVSEVDKNLHETNPVIIGYEWDIYLMQENFSMYQPDNKFFCVWSGTYVAEGFLEAANLYGIIKTQSRESTIRDCIELTSKHIPSVRGKGKILSLQKSNWHKVSGK